MQELQANSKGITNNPASHNAYGALINKMAVCDGFSSVFSLLAQKLGFDCMLVVGKSMYSSTSLQNHAWNIVKINNQYYHMDVTWDTRKFNEFGEFSYEYFALSDNDIMYDHNWDKKLTPRCPNDDFSIYRKNGLYINNKEHLSEIVKAFGRANTNVLKIKISRNINLPNNAGNYLANMVLNEVVKPGERKQASYSWNEHTRCFLAKII